MSFWTMRSGREVNSGRRITCLIKHPCIQRCVLQTCANYTIMRNEICSKTSRDVSRRIRTEHADHHCYFKTNVDKTLAVYIGIINLRQFYIIKPKSRASPDCRKVWMRSIDRTVQPQLFRPDLPHGPIVSTVP